MEWPEVRLVGLPGIAEAAIGQAQDSGHHQNDRRDSRRIHRAHPHHRVTVPRTSVVSARKMIAPETADVTRGLAGASVRWRTPFDPARHQCPLGLSLISIRSNCPALASKV